MKIFLVRLQSNKTIYKLVVFARSTKEAREIATLYLREYSNENILDIKKSVRSDLIIMLNEKLKQFNSEDELINEEKRLAKERGCYFGG